MSRGRAAPVSGPGASNGIGETIGRERRRRGLVEILGGAPGWRGWSEGSISDYVASSDHSWHDGKQLWECFRSLTGMARKPSIEVDDPEPRASIARADHPGTLSLRQHSRVHGPVRHGQA